MKPVLKEIYLDMLKHIQDYGFKLYKGKIWKYDPSIGYVMSLEVDSTRWGTLNDIVLCAATSQEPVKLKETRKANGFYFKTCLRVGMYVLRHEGKQVITWDDPYEKADLVMKKQYEALKPYLGTYLYPLLMFDNDVEKYLASMEKLYLMECEAYLGEKGVKWLDLALEAYRLGDIKRSMRIIDLNTDLCEKQIEKYNAESKDSVRWWMQEKQKTIELADLINKKPETVRRIIDENRAISEKTCQQFFTSRFFSLKS